MFKKLFIRLYHLIAKTPSAWQEISNEQDRNNETFYNVYLFPAVGMIALCSFIIAVFFKSWDISMALKGVLKEVFIVGGSFYANVFIISRWIFPCVEIAPNRSLAERFTGYASSLVFVLAMLNTLFSGLVFLAIISFYTFYIVWPGAVEFLKIDDKQVFCFSFLGKKYEWPALPAFTFFAGTLLIFVPILLHFVIKIIMPNF